MDLTNEEWAALPLGDRLRLVAYRWHGENVAHPEARALHDAADLIEDMVSRAGPLEADGGPPS